MSLRPTPLPHNAADVADIVADALRSGDHLEIRGGGSKAQIGAPRMSAILETAGISGVIDYDPAELVLTVRAGTSLAEIEALVGSRGQMLAFDPFDHGPIFGNANATATIGGVVAAGVAGSRRLSAGSARDHLLGFEAVSGRAERFIAGAKVVKNVTGYDLPKLAAASWGRLFVLTEITLKVLPRPTTQATVAVEGLSADQARRALARAMRSQADVQAAAHIPAHATGGGALTAVRLEGFGPSVAARIAMMNTLWRDDGSPRVLSEDTAANYWSGIRNLSRLEDGRPLWRINTPPSGGPIVVAALEPFAPNWLFDWAGGLIWMTLDCEAASVRAAAKAAGGHAMLMRAHESMQRTTPPFHPPEPGVGALEARVRAAFDPQGVFETGRFLDATHAD